MNYKELREKLSTIKDWRECSQNELGEMLDAAMQRVYSLEGSITREERNLALLALDGSMVRCKKCGNDIRDSIEYMITYHTRPRQ